MNDSYFKMKPSPNLEGVSAYHKARHGAPVDLLLDGNEGSMPPTELLEELARAGSDGLRLYPDVRPLEKRIVEMMGIEPSRVVVTAGGNDAIDRALRSVLAPGREIVVSVPTYEMIERYAALTGADIVRVPWSERRYPVDDVLARVTERTAVIAIVTPNNPTGFVASADDLRRLSRGAPRALLLVDLAYTEFADEDLTEVALSLPNAVIMRTLSKAWGLAGLRVGWAAGPPELISWMRTSGNPYAVSSASLAIARARLEGGDEVDEFVDRVRGEVREMSELIKGLGGEVPPSQANFVMARLEDAEWVRDGLAGLGIAVRIFPGRPELEGCIRITMPGDERSFERLSCALKSVIEPEAILFDIDDTLADVTESYRRATVATAEAFGVEVTYDDISDAKAAGDANNDWELTWRLITGTGVDASIGDVTTVFEELYQGVEGKPGLKMTERLMMNREELSELAKRFKLGVVTGRPEGDAREFLTREGIDDLFGAVVTMDDGPLKPNPAPMRIALEKLGVKYAWMVGDTPDDMRAARGAGVVPVGVVAPSEEPGRARRELIAAGASRVLDKLEQLKEMLP